jgi:hypothetical protein
MVVIDATMLMLLLRSGIPVPAGPDGLPIEKPKERLELLVERLQKARTKLIIPTPALSEILVRAGVQASQEIVEHLNKYAVWRGVNVHSVRHVILHPGCPGSDYEFPIRLPLIIPPLDWMLLLAQITKSAH